MSSLAMLEHVQGPKMVSWSLRVIQVAKRVSGHDELINLESRKRIKITGLESK